jgi:dienelactone hydrolase
VHADALESIAGTALAGALSALAIACAFVLAAAPVAAGQPSAASPGAGSPPPGAAAAPSGEEANPPPPSPGQAPPYAIGMRVLRLVDRTRVIRSAGGRREPRTLATYVRYPAVGKPSGSDLPGAPAARGRFPLIVFGHGFDTTPSRYALLLRSWARAGYVVAAPVFPLENANAPGGPDESDLINQPTDMSFVISRLLAASAEREGALAGLIDASEVAVSGHSDGGETALAAAYSRRFRDRRVGAAVILAGAEMAGVGGFSFPPGSPPLLAAQGTADTVNEPRFTSEFFRPAHRPKYLLRLPSAGHLPPYTDEHPQLSIVERVTIAFLDRYLKHRAQSVATLAGLAGSGQSATLLAQP